MFVVVDFTLKLINTLVLKDFIIYHKFGVAMGDQTYKKYVSVIEFYLKSTE